MSEKLSKDDVLKIIDNMIDEEREALIDDIPRLYCINCGNKFDENGECENFSKNGECDNHG